MIKDNLKLILRIIFFSAVFFFTLKSPCFAGFAAPDYYGSYYSTGGTTSTTTQNSYPVSGFDPSLYFFGPTQSTYYSPPTSTTQQSGSNQTSYPTYTSTTSTAPIEQTTSTSEPSLQGSQPTSNPIQNTQQATSPETIPQVVSNLANVVGLPGTLGGDGCNKTTGCGSCTHNSFSLRTGSHYEICRLQNP